MSGLLEICGLAALLVGISTWGVVVLGAPARNGGGHGRALLARMWLYAPLWVPAVVVASALIPGLAGVLWPASDHCLPPGSYHHHLCLLHPPHLSGAMMTWVLPLLLGLPLCFVVVMWARKTWTQWRLARVLVALSAPSALGPDVRLLDDVRPLALTVGLGRATVLVSTGLLERVSPATLDVVLAHERAHVRRGDTRTALLDRLVGSLLPAWVAGGLLEAIAQGREQACDAAAARLASPARVAAALIEVARLGVEPLPGGVSIVSGAVEARIRHLLEPPRHSRRWVLGPAVVFVGLVLVGAGPGHTVIEQLINQLLH